MATLIESNYELVATKEVFVKVDENGYWGLENPLRCCKSNNYFNLKTKEERGVVICPVCKSKLDATLTKDCKAIASTYRLIDDYPRPSVGLECDPRVSFRYRIDNFFVALVIIAAVFALLIQTYILTP